MAGVDHEAALRLASYVIEKKDKEDISPRSIDKLHNLALAYETLHTRMMTTNACEDLVRKLAAESTTADYRQDSETFLEYVTEAEEICDG